MALRAETGSKVPIGRRSGFQEEKIAAKGRKDRKENSDFITANKHEYRNFIRVHSRLFVVINLGKGLRGLRSYVSLAAILCSRQRRAHFDVRIILLTADEHE